MDFHLFLQSILVTASPVVIVMIIKHYNKTSRRAQRLWEEKVESKQKLTDELQKKLERDFSAERRGREELRDQLKAALSKMIHHGERLEDLNKLFSSYVAMYEKRIGSLETEVLQLSENAQLVRTKKSTNGGESK